MKISVVGTGYVGLVTGTCLAELGHDVICLDIDQEKITGLNQGIIPIYEPGLEELILRNYQKKRLKFSSDIAQGIQNTKIIFNAVATPNLSNGKPDLGQVFAVAKNFGRNLNNYKIFVNKSSVPVGTSEKIREIIIKEVGEKINFDIVDNPEFLREGSAIDDFMRPDRIVVGIENEKSKKIMEKVYRPFLKEESPLFFTDIKSAEIIKYAANAFLATKISFINEIANFCDIVGGDVRKVAKGIGLDRRIGQHFLNAGIGYGGSCFPKDLQAMIEKGREVGYDFKLLKATQEINEKQKIILLKKIKKVFNNIKELNIAIWGLAFKPGTDDLRGAPALDIIAKLIEENVKKIKIYDPVAIKKAKKIIKSPKVEFAKNGPFSVLEEADCLLILTEWDEFKAIDLWRVKKLLKGKYIFDGRNIYDAQELKKIGLRYFCIGGESE